MAAIPAIMLATSAFAADTTVINGQHVVVDTVPISVVGPDRLTVEQGGSIEGDGQTPVSTSGAGAVIDNSGKIFTEDENSDAIAVDATGAGQNIEINNQAGAEISAVDAAALSGSGTGSGTITVNNSGLIIARRAENQDYSEKAIDFHDFKGTSSDAQLSVVINNFEGGRIEAEGHDTIRLGKANVSATVNNWGEIISSGTGGGSNDGIDLQDKQRDVLINNYSTGLIRANQHGIHGKISTTIVNDGRIVGELGSGINIDLSGNTVSVTNRGTVTGGAIAGGDGDGIDIDGKLLLENYGRVEGLNGFTAEGLAIGGGTINNYAGSTIYGEGRGILADDSDEGAAFYDTSIYNEGLIEAGTFDGIKLIGEHDDTIVNKGTIRGGSSGLAIDMGGGNDTLALYGGYVIDGIADGGAGQNQIRLLGAGGTLGSNFYDFSSVEVEEGVWATQLGGLMHNVQNGATLTYDGQLAIAPNVTVNGGGRLEAVGQMSDVYIYGGTLAIAGRNGIGQLDVTNGLALSDDWVALTAGVLEVTVAADGTSDLLNLVSATNSQTLSIDHGTYDTFDYGPTVSVVALAGNYDEETEYHIIHVDGLISGNGFRPEDVTTNFAFLDASVRLDPSDVYLTLVRNDLSFFDVAETANQKAVAAGLVSVGGSDLHGYVTGMTGDEEDVRTAFDALSGDSHASVGSALISGQLGTADAVSERIDAAFQAQDQMPMAPLGYVASDTRTDSHLGYRVWGQGVARYGSADSTSGEPGYKQNTGGLLFGADTAVSYNVVAGIFGGYSRTSLDIKDRNATADADNFTFGGYVGGRFDAFGVKLGGAFTHHSISTERGVVAGALDETLTAEYGANTAQAFAELNYELALSRDLSARPFVGLGLVNYSADSFTEKGGVSAVSSDGVDYTTGMVTIGLAGSADLVFGDNMLLRLNGSAGWQHATNEDVPTAELSFAGGDPFTVQGAPVVTDALVLKAGASVDVSERFAVGVSYGGQFADGQDMHSLRGTITGKF